MAAGAVLQGISRIIGVGSTTIHRVGAAVNSAAQHQVKNPWGTADKVTVSSSSADLSQKEVLEATSDLQDALIQNITSVSRTLDCETVSSSFQSVYDNPDSVEVSDIQETKGTSYENLVYRVELELDQENAKVLQKSGHSNVFKAFNLLQSNPSVQGMVASLASDKAFLDAMMKNEKVLEFRQSLLEGESEISDANKDADKPPRDHKNPFIEAIENMKVKVMGYTQKITEVCNHFMGFAEEDGDFMERALKASSMLGIAILMIFLFKRV